MVFIYILNLVQNKFYVGVASTDVFQKLASQVFLDNLYTVIDYDHSATESIIKSFIRLSTIFDGIKANVQTNIYSPMLGFLLSKKLIVQKSMNKEK